MGSGFYIPYSYIARELAIYVTGSPRVLEWQYGNIWKHYGAESIAVFVVGGVMFSCPCLSIPVYQPFRGVGGLSHLGEGD